MRLPKDYAAPKQEQTAIEYIWEQKGCVQQRREPIVRCRDCYFAEEIEGGYWCDRFDSGKEHVTSGGYCAWGERKANA